MIWPFRRRFLPKSATLVTEFFWEHQNLKSTLKNGPENRREMVVLGVRGGPLCRLMY